MTPLDLAARRGHARVVRVVAHGAASRLTQHVEVALDAVVVDARHHGAEPGDVDGHARLQGPGVGLAV